MSESQNLTVGFIPNDWSPERERICVGDAGGSGTVESSFQMYEKAFHFPNLDIQIDSSIWDPKSTLWRNVAKTLQRDLGIEIPKLSAIRLGRAYRIFTEEDDDYTGLVLVAGPEDGGEFRNDGGKFNGKYYVKFEHEEDGEYFEERILIIL